MWKLTIARKGVALLCSHWPFRPSSFNSRASPTEKDYLFWRSPISQRFGVRAGISPGRINAAKLEISDNNKQVSSKKKSTCCTTYRNGVHHEVGKSGNLLRSKHRAEFARNSDNFFISNSYHACREQTVSGRLQRTPAKLSSKPQHAITHLGRTRST